jgi:tripeptidyl-peptidase I
VGATRLYEGQSIGDPESAALVDLPRGVFTTSGGFSNIFPQADYQAEAVNSFLSANTFPFKSYNVSAGDSVGARGGVFNIAGRGIPDVSANGAFYATFVKGVPHQAFGTSFSTPLWAAIITLVRQLSVTKS